MATQGTITATQGSIHKFLVIWFGQLISLVGSGMTSFALGIWVYQRTGSITQFALISVCVMLPGIVVSPFAGALVDRFNRRTMMMLSDIGAGFSSLVLAVLFFTGQLTMWEIYVLVSVGSLAGAFRMPSYMPHLDQMILATREPVVHFKQTADLLMLERMAAAHVPNGLRRRMVAMAQSRIPFSVAPDPHREACHNSLICGQRLP